MKTKVFLLVILLSLAVGGKAQGYTYMEFVAVCDSLVGTRASIDKVHNEFPFLYNEKQKCKGGKALRQRKQRLYVGSIECMTSDLTFSNLFLEVQYDSNFKVTKMDLALVRTHDNDSRQSIEIIRAIFLRMLSYVNVEYLDSYGIGKIFNNQGELVGWGARNGNICVQMEMSKFRGLDVSTTFSFFFEYNPSKNVKLSPVVSSPAPKEGIESKKRDESRIEEEDNKEKARIKNYEVYKFIRLSKETFFKYKSKYKYYSPVVYSTSKVVWSLNEQGDTLNVRVDFQSDVKKKYIGRRYTLCVFDGSWDVVKKDIIIDSLSVQKQFLFKFPVMKSSKSNICLCVETSGTDWYNRFGPDIYYIDVLDYTIEKL